MSVVVWLIKGFDESVVDMPEADISSTTSSFMCYLGTSLSGYRSNKQNITQSSKEITSYQNDNFINWPGTPGKKVTNFGLPPHFMDNIRKVVFDRFRSYWLFPVMWRGWIRTRWRCINEFTSISKLARLQGPPAHQEGSVNSLRMKMIKMMKIHTILVGQSNQKTSKTRYHHHFPNTKEKRKKESTNAKKTARSV